jgi:hypothetical protein
MAPDTVEQMTLAICTACGLEKFGAFVPCKHCGYTPTTVADRAKSLMLSEHKCSLSELQQLGESIREGRPVVHSSVTLALLAESIIAEDYYWSNVRPDREEVKCMYCGAIFADVLCPSCRRTLCRALLVCSGCSSIYEGDASFCQNCGRSLTNGINTTGSSIASNLMLAIERISDPSHLKSRFTVLAANLSRLSKNDVSATCSQIEWLAFYLTGVRLRESLHAPGLETAIAREMNHLYSLSLMVQGNSEVDSAVFLAQVLSRFEEYDVIMNAFSAEPNHNPDRWFLALAKESAVHCYRSQQGDAIAEAVLMIGYFSKVIYEVVRSNRPEMAPE